MVQLYFNKIIERTITIEDVPKLWRAKVQAKLDEYYALIAEEIEEEVLNESEPDESEGEPESDSEEE